MTTEFANAVTWAGVITLVASLWALWQRRFTWRMYWESAATAAVSFNLLGLIMASEYVTDTLGRWLFELTGIGGLSNYLDHLLFTGALAAFVTHMQFRTEALGDRLNRKMFRRLNAPLTVVVPLLLALLYCSPRVHSGPVDLDEMHVSIDCGTPWVMAYWMVLCATDLYLLCYLGVLLLEVRIDPRSRRYADAYLVAVLFGVMAIGICLVTRLYDDHDNEKYMWLFWCMSVTVFCGGTGYSWWAKERALRAWEQEIILEWAAAEPQEQQGFPMHDASRSDQREDSHGEQPPTNAP